jgi:hypothetical protein
MAERRAAVPVFLRKVHKWRPKIVCMVGKGIWEDVFAYAVKASKGKCAGDGIHVERCTSGGDSGQKEWADLKTSFEYDIQPVCLLHGPHKSNGRSKCGASNEMTRMKTIDTATKRTLFFVVPSTSSRVLTHQVGCLVVLIYSC